MQVAVIVFVFTFYIAPLFLPCVREENLQVVFSILHSLIDYFSEGRWKLQPEKKKRIQRKKENSEKKREFREKKRIQREKESSERTSNLRKKNTSEKIEL